MGVLTNNSLKIKSPNIFMHVCQNVGIRDIHGQIPKRIYEVSYLFYLVIFLSSFLLKWNKRSVIHQKLILKFY